jgi:uncharacterized protein (DUF111 family)
VGKGRLGFHSNIRSAIIAATENLWDVWVHCFSKTNSIGIRNFSKTKKILSSFLKKNFILSQEVKPSKHLFQLYFVSKFAQ